MSGAASAADAVDIVELDPARSRDRSAFVALPFEMARGHPAWHPGLRRLASEILDPARNPFWRSRVGSFFLARREGRVVGRMAVLDPGAFPGEPGTAVLAFPDFVDDPAVSGRLFGAVERRARVRGARRLVGPLNPDIHHDVGIQIEGHGRRNAVFMGWQPPYYRAHFEDGAGFAPLADFHAWRLDRDAFAGGGRLARLVARVGRSGALVVRPIDRRRFADELALFHRLYSASFRDHWGFAPPTWDEFRFVAGDLKHVVRSRMALVAEWRGAPAGFVLGVPDLHQALPRHGRLTPASALGTLIRLRRIDEVRVMIAGVLPRFRRHGVHLALFDRIAREVFALGYRGGEISWVKADNEPMARGLELLGASVARTYRVYAKALHQ